MESIKKLFSKVMVSPEPQGADPEFTALDETGDFYELSERDDFYELLDEEYEKVKGHHRAFAAYMKEELGDEDESIKSYIEAELIAGWNDVRSWKINESTGVLIGWCHPDKELPVFIQALKLKIK